MKIMLQDERGETSKYPFELTVIKPLELFKVESNKTSKTFSKARVDNETALEWPQDRPKINLFIKSISPNGEVIIEFSERLRPISDYSINLTQTRNLNFLLNLTYFSRVRETNLLASECKLVNWTLTNFTSDQLIL